MPRKLSTVFLIALLASVSSCDRATDVGSSNPPHAKIVTAPDGDIDGDGRIDLLVSWPDSEHIDASKSVIREIGSANPNLIGAWSTATTDTSIAVHEPLEQLLPPGEHQFEIQIFAKSGARTVDTAVVTTMPGKLIKTLAPDRDPMGMRAYEIALCNGVGYMPAGPYMIVFDPDSLRILADVRNPNTLLELKRPACAKTGEVFVTEPLYSFNEATQQWLEIPGTFGADAIAQSRTNPNLLYIGEHDGAIAEFDAVSHQRLGRVSDTSAVARDITSAIAVMPGDEKLYFTRVYAGGIVVADPRTHQTLRHIALTGSGYGSGDDLALSPDSRLLYAAIYDGTPRGVEIVDTQLDVPQQIIVLNDCRPTGLAVSPSGRRLFVTTQDLDTAQSQNLLIDLRTNAVIQRFPRPRDGRRIDYKVIFHPNGRYIFVVRNMAIDVYLNRE